MAKMTPEEVEQARQDSTNTMQYGAVTDTERKAHELYWRKVLEHQIAEAVKPLQEQITTLTSKVEGLTAIVDKQSAQVTGAKYGEQLGECNCHNYKLEV